MGGFPETPSKLHEDVLQIVCDLLTCTGSGQEMCDPVWSLSLSYPSYLKGLLWICLNKDFFFGLLFTEFNNNYWEPS